MHECVSNLKLHKAAAHDGIYNEHVIFAGPQVEVHLCLLFIAAKRQQDSLCLLGCKQSFRQSPFNGLLSKLISRKFPYHFIAILYNWYSNLRCSVVWNKLIGTAFPVLCGVRQGGILSPYLFTIYVDDIIAQLRNSGYGIQISNIFAGYLLYADDIVLLSCIVGMVYKSWLIFAANMETYRI